MQAATNIRCSSCGAQLGVPSELVRANRAVRCPKCQQVFRAGEGSNGTGLPGHASPGAYRNLPVTPQTPPALGDVMQCPHCRRDVANDRRLAGRVVACPHCKGRVQMPSVAYPQLDLAPPPSLEHERDPPLRRRRPKRGRAKLWIALGSGAALAVMLGAFLLWFLPKPRSSALTDEITFFPDDCHIIASADVQGILGSHAGKTFMQSDLSKLIGKELARGMEGQGLEQQYELFTGLCLKDLTRCTVAGRFEAPDFVVILKTAGARNFRPTDRGQRLHFQEEKVDKHVLYYSPNGGGPVYCIPDDSTVLFAADLGLLRRIMTRNGPGSLSPNLQTLMKRLDFSRSVAVAIDLSAVTRNRNLGREMDRDLAGFFDAVEGITMHLKTGSDVSWDMALLSKETGRPVVTGQNTVDPEFVCKWVGKLMQNEQLQRERWREDQRKWDKKGFDE
jgi:predicted Zn finger-like uncharacterized protein